ncbi:Spo0B domain-containing protein [Planococcus beigongshangi]|uniref:Spo0B domain-containing protein n=1 Tax=Planococcus beigongshangi TaxID=2782536 RepID=UPI00193C3D49|nr:Spo0B domain-containing protein [Planococcus beigongshangi]
MDNPMTVAQALRHARHDFLNELQLIGMKLDLGRTQDVKSIIRSHAEAAVQLSRLSALKMPATENWLLTAEWRFPEFRFRVECAAEKGGTPDDAIFAEWLEQFFTTLKKRPEAHANSCRISLEQQESIFTIELKIEGNPQTVGLPEIPGLLARERVAADNWKIIVSTQMEG